MGIFSNIRNILKSSNDMSMFQEEDASKKSTLVTGIINSIDKIKRYNCFDSSIRNIGNISSTELSAKSLNELEELYSKLDRRLSELDRQSQRIDTRSEVIERAKWTGEIDKSLGIDKQDLDRLQRER